MFNYSWWILNEAKKRGFNKIYFLARDGYLLREIAERICKKARIGIECRYLYCSRASLRTPSYHLIGDEAFDLLTLYGYRVTPDSVLSRICSSGSEKEQVFNEIGVDASCRSVPMSKPEFDVFSAKLRSSHIFNKIVKETSLKEYDSTINYFKQEGLFDDDKVVIADSGWTGSMQRSLRQLLASSGYKGKLYGFYFGMFVEPRSKDDGEYMTYYFNSSGNVKHKVMFNNNVFECMLSAPHPMTTGYQIRGCRVDPVFSECNDETMSELVKAQISGALKYTESVLSSEYSFGDFSLKHSLKTCYKILKRAMVYPSVKEAEMYSHFAFCDDVTEAYHNPLADPKQKELLKKYMLLPRIVSRLFRIKPKNTEQLFWTYGVISLCPAAIRPWYRFNIITWEWLKFILKK